MVDFRKLVDHVRLSPFVGKKPAAKPGKPAASAMRPDTLKTAAAPDPAITNAMQGVNGRLKQIADGTKALAADRDQAGSTMEATKLGLAIADLQRAATQLGDLRDSLAAIAVRRPRLSESDSEAVAKLAAEAGHERDPARLAAIATSIRKRANPTPVDAQLFNATRALDWRQGMLMQQATALTSEAQGVQDVKELQRLQITLDDVLKHRALVAETQDLVGGLAFGKAPRGELKDTLFKLAHQAAEAPDLAALHAINQRLREVLTSAP
ncbi:MAG: hypothetical protein VKS61_03170 [Candidatus Sericytochromatia bacterium]|nr:hypothetical protein [Candidatus Sericytochromatia bacterium]